MVDHVTTRRIYSTGGYYSFHPPLTSTRNRYSHNPPPQIDTPVRDPFRQNSTGIEKYKVNPWTKTTELGC